MLVQVSVLLPEKLVERLRELAEERGVSLSELISEALREVLSLIASSDLALPRNGRVN